MDLRTTTWCKKQHLMNITVDPVTLYYDSFHSFIALCASKHFSLHPYFVLPVGIPNNTNGLPSPAGLSTLKYPFLSN